MFVVEGERFVVIINLWYYWVGEDFGYYVYFVVQMWVYFVIYIMYLVVLLFFLIFLVFWIINVWFGFDVVKLCVFYVFVFGLDVFIGY